MTMEELKESDIIAEAFEKTQELRKSDHSKVKQLIEHSVAIISIAVVLLTVVLYAFNDSYYRIYNIPASIIPINLKDYLPFVLQISFVLVYILYYIITLKKDYIIKRKSSNFLRIFYGWVILTLIFDYNDFQNVVGITGILIIPVIVPIIIECLISLYSRQKSDRSVDRTGYKTSLEDNISSILLFDSYFKYGLFFIIMAILLASLFGWMKAKSNYSYQTCIVDSELYVVIADLDGMVLVENASAENNVLSIKTASYRYIPKDDLVLTYQEYEHVNIIKQQHLKNMWEEKAMTPSITDWLMVGITFVYVVATIFICVANYKSARATREQVAEAKRQFEEANRAFVTVTFEVVRGGLLVLQIKNEGHRIADKVNIHLAPKFVENLPDEFAQRHAEMLCKSVFQLGIGQAKYLTLGGNIQLESIASELLSVEISYQDSFAQYHETSEIDCSQYFWELLYESPTDDLYQEIKKLSKSLQSIDKSMQKQLQK